MGFRKIRGMSKLTGILKDTESEAKDLQERITQTIMDDHGDDFPNVSMDNHFTDYIVGVDGRCYFVLPNNRHRQYYTTAFEPGELKPDFIEPDDSNFFTGGPV